MGDAFREIGSYSELKFSREQGFFDKSNSIRLLIGCLFAVCLFLFLHFREVRVEVLELNSIAPKYIVSQVDFDFFDEEATIILKQEALHDVGKIYNIVEKEVRQRRIELENSFIHDQSWRSEAPDTTFEEMYKAVDLLEKMLVSLRFTDSRTLQKIQEARLPTSDYLLFHPLNFHDKTYLPTQVWNHVIDTLKIEGNFNEQTLVLLTNTFKKQDWKLEEDIVDERFLHKRIQATVPDKYTHVSAGSRIIDQGEKVTARHIAMLQAMKNSLKEQRHLWQSTTLLGSALMTLVLTAVFAGYLHSSHPKIYASNRKLFLLMTMIIMTLAWAKGVEYVVLNASNNLIEIVRYPLLVPFAAILVCSLINASVATFITVFLTVVLTITLPFDNQGFLITNLGAAVVAIISARTLRRRKEIFIVCGKAWLFCVAIIISMNLYDEKLNSTALLGDLFSSLFFMIFTAVLAVGLLPLLESLFHIMTDVTLMEYMDPNHELLRRLSFEAPGTYHHSVVVGGIAEAAAVSIGANGLFCRVASLYHDIGKMATPQYFTENQQGMNIHQLLTPIESAHVIIAHVSEGVSMARKAGLPEQFINIIKEHHGTTMVYYFYRKQLSLLNGHCEQIDEVEFRYAGPKPRSKESAIIMLADSLEASSRCLDRVDRESVLQLIDRVIREKAEDGQLDECLLTFEELGIVKKTMGKILLASAHSRVKYPARDKPFEKPASSPTRDKPFDTPGSPSEVT